MRIPDREADGSAGMFSSERGGPTSSGPEDGGPMRSSSWASRLSSSDSPTPPFELDDIAGFWSSAGSSPAV